MRNTIILLQLLLMAYSGAEAQTTPPNPPVTNYTLSFIEDEEIVNYLSDYTMQNAIAGTDLSSLEPRSKTRKFTYIWGNNGYSRSEIQNFTPLNPGDHYSFPNTTVYIGNGTIERKDASGNTISYSTSSQPPMSAQQYRLLTPDAFSLTKAVPANYNIVPAYSTNMISELIRNGFTVHKAGTDFLSVAKGLNKTIYDNSAKTISTYEADADNPGVLKNISTIYYEIRGGQRVKLKEVTQQFRDMYNGLCLMTVATKTYRQISSVGTELSQRSGADAVDGERLTVYPNPSRGEFLLRPSAKADVITGVKVYDTSGRLIMTDHRPDQNGIYRVGLGDAPSGVYILSCEINGKTHTQKVIQQ